MGTSNCRINGFLLLVIIANVKYSDTQTCLGTRNEICYFLPNQAIPWQNASATCISQGATLPYVKDSATQTYIKGLLTSGNTPDVWLALSGAPGDWEYVADKSKIMHQGCFKDIFFNRDLSGYQATSDSLVPSICLTNCSTLGYTYAGVRDRNVCNCGNSYGAHGPGTDNQCVVTCAGNETLYCGGHGSNEVLRINGTYSNWGYLQPLNGTCAALLPEGNSRQFATLACTSSIRYICQINAVTCPGLTGYASVLSTCIYISTNAASFSASREACRTLNGDLLKVSDASFMASLKAKLVTNGVTLEMYWIGLTKYTWKFINDQEPTYFPWAAGQPQMVTASCAAMSKDANYAWIAENCTKSLTVLCAKDVSTTTEMTTPAVTTANQETTAASNSGSNNSGNNNSGNTGNTGNTGNSSTGNNSGPNTGSAAAGASTGTDSTGLSDYQIVIVMALVVLCVVIIIVIILVIVKKKSNDGNGRVSPDSMRRSPAPSEGNDNDTAGLVVTDHTMFSARGANGTS